jgi:uncharacterized alpha-E superfamily protein
MLSRTADNLYWMARYTERAENTARLLDVNLQTSLLPHSSREAEQGWRAMLGISELDALYSRRHDDLNARDVLHFMVQDRSNMSSIASCLGAARENARAVRGVLTTEVWETLNTTWLEMQTLLDRGTALRDPGQFFEWVKHRSHLSRGTTIGTMLKDEAFHFIRMGTHLERADNTARILDVKFHGLQAGDESGADSSPVFYYWAAILRSVSAFEIYRRVYRDVITPERVAELLVLRPDMPRSLMACVEEVVSNLAAVRNDLSADTERYAGRLLADLEFSRIDEILSGGLHGFLTRFLEQVSELGKRIGRDFLVPIAS